MTISANKYVQELEKVWDTLQWNRKFENAFPNDYDSMPLLAHAYSLEEIEDLKNNIPDSEETDEGCYTAWLFSTSTGEALAITYLEFE